MTLLHRACLLTASLSLVGFFSVGCEESDSDGADGPERGRPDAGGQPGGGESDAGGSGAADTGGGSPLLDVDLGGDDDTGSGGGGGGGGEDDPYFCVEIFECLNEAGEPTPEVLDTCKEPASSESGALFDAALGCIQSRCSSAGTQDEFVACQNRECATELRACEGDLPSGDLDCTGVLQCINTSAGTPEDVRRCEAQGSEVAQSQIGDIRACISANCAGITDDDQFVACQQENCQQELATCTGQTVPSGDDTCEEVVTCLLDCRGSQTCADTCIAQGTTASAQAAIAFYNCGVSPCGSSAGTPDDYISCTQTACPTEYDACY